MNRLFASVGAGLMAGTETFIIVASLVSLAVISQGLQTFLMPALYTSAAFSVLPALWIFRKVWAKESEWITEDLTASKSSV